MTEQTATAAPPADPPPPPPAHWEADVVAADGGTVHLRPISPEDADGLVGLMERSSDQLLAGSRPTIRSDVRSVESSLSAMYSSPSSFHVPSRQV